MSSLNESEIPGESRRPEPELAKLVSLVNYNVSIFHLTHRSAAVLQRYSITFPAHWLSGREIDGRTVAFSRRQLASLRSDLQAGLRPACGI